MKYTIMNESDRSALLHSLAVMPLYLEQTFENLTPEQAIRRTTKGEFSPVEQVWHLADLETEAYGVRIRRLLLEPNPHLSNFDGDRVAAEKHYQTLSLTEGLERFKQARRFTIEAFNDIQPNQWPLSGELEGVGPISLCDLPSFLLQHDAAHRAEIESWKQENLQKRVCSVLY